MSELAHFLPRFRWGGVTASGGSNRVSIDMSYEFNKVVPNYVMQITGGRGTSRPLEQGKPEEAVANYWDAVEQLARAGADVVVLRGVPVSAYLGRPRVLELLDETTRKYGIRATSSLESILAAARHLRAGSLTIGSRWDAALNQRVKRYCEDGGIAVDAILTSDTAEDGPQGFEEELKATLELGRTAARGFPGAGAIAVPGRAMALHAVPVLEGEFERPVLTMLNCDVWEVLVHRGIIPPVKGWGALLATP